MRWSGRGQGLIFAIPGPGDITGAQQRLASESFNENKTFDIVACGQDYCGVSVGPKGACGPVLFRFLAKSINGQEELRGHGRWGDARKNIEMFAYADKEAQGGRFLYLNLGDGHDFGERSGNMPKFAAGYRPVGAARCVAR